MEPTLRQARLRASFAHLYPHIRPDSWERASTMALRVVEALAGRTDPNFTGRERILPDEHFEFRGGGGPAQVPGRRLGDGAAEGTLRERVTSMRLILQSIEAELQKGKIPTEGLDDFKVAVDDLRLRVWSILAAATTGDPQGALERFRLRRAIELTRSVAHDLETGAMSAVHGELPELRIAVHRLSGAMETAAP